MYFAQKDYNIILLIMEGKIEAKEVRREELFD